MRSILIRELVRKITENYVRTAHAIVWAAAFCASVGACSRPGSKAGPQPIAAPDAPQLSWRKQPGERAESLPMSLTASDGSGLALVSVRARAVIQDPLAFTELHLKFRNPEARRREGRFQISLPANAAISRFAMRIGSEFQEGEVVERRRAQAVYEDFLHRKQDPALLENDAGNEFSARVFPIEANEDKELIISYSQELPARNSPYVLALQGLPRLAELAVDVRAGDERLQLKEQDYVPASDLEVRLPWQKPVALRSENLVLARVAPVLEVPAAAMRGVTILFDTSASRALGFGAQIERLSAVLEELREQAKSEIELRVVGFDQTSEELYRGPASEFGLRAKAKLLARDALGASDLGQALAYLAKTGGAHARVIVVSDGVVTAGVDDTTALREAVTKLAAHGVRRLDVLAEGGIQDRDTLAILTRAGLAETGVLLEARAPAAELAARLLKGVRDRVQVNLAGATWVYPSVLEGLQPGDERLVFAELSPETPVQIELVGAGAEAHETREVPHPLLERAWARAKIESRTLALRALPTDAITERVQLEREIVELSVKHRVVSDYTALLVLETDRDYARFGLAHNALTSILRVTDEGLELWDRRSGPVHQIAVDERPTLAEAEPVPTIASPAEGMVLGAERKGSGAVPGGAARARQAAPLDGEDDFARADKAKESRTAAPPPMKTAAAPASSGRAQPMAAPEAMPAAPATSLARRSAGPAELGAIGSIEASASARHPAPANEAAAQIAAEDRRPLLEPRALVKVRSASNLPSSEVVRALRSGVTARAKQCFAESSSAAAGERLAFELIVAERGNVTQAYVTGAGVADRGAQNCFLNGVRNVVFPKPAGGQGIVQAELSWTQQEARPPLAAPRPRPAVQVERPALRDAYEGTLAEVLELIQRGDNAAALARATAAHADEPADVMGLIALGEALEAQRDFPRAARAYGSLIDLFPSRADLRRMASARLERLPSDGLALAIDSYRRAVVQRPDHPSGPRALAYALLKSSDRAQAFETIERALERSYSSDRFEGVDRILREDLGLIGAAWIRVDQAAEPRIRSALERHGATLEKTPSTRFVLSWETDANDVDFHIYDGRGGHAYYMQRKLPSGGSLYADITTGYGPECFAITGKARAYPYVLQAHYFARGPMGYGMGKLQVVEHDGQGGLAFAEHPFVIMKDKAFVELARLTAPLHGA